MKRRALRSHLTLSESRLLVSDFQMHIEIVLATFDPIFQYGVAARARFHLRTYQAAPSLCHLHSESFQWPEPATRLNGILLVWLLLPDYRIDTECGTYEGGEQLSRQADSGWLLLSKKFSPQSLSLFLPRTGIAISFGNCGKDCDSAAASAVINWHIYSVNQCWPSFSNSVSASLGPQVPAG